MRVEIVFETHATSIDRGVRRAGSRVSFRRREGSGEGIRRATPRRRHAAVFTSDLRRPLVYDGARILLVGHSATRWALDHLLVGTPLEELVGPFDWQEGWEYVYERSLPSG